MSYLPSPGHLSVHRANFDACADKIPTFLLFEQEVMGDRMMATEFRPTRLSPTPRHWMLSFNITAVTS
jgi:hypothetical protein